MYTCITVSAVGTFIHVTITVNRLWAMASPLSYRRVHSRKTSIFMCGAALAYVILITMIDFIPRASHLKLPLDTFSCINGMASGELQAIAINGVAVLTVVFAYPLIAYKRFQLRNSRQNLVQPSVLATIHTDSFTVTMVRLSKEQTLPLPSSAFGKEAVLKSAAVAFCVSAMNRYVTMPTRYATYLTVKKLRCSVLSIRD